MNSLIEQFGEAKRWVNWVYKPIDGKQTKMPLGSSNKPDTWSVYEDLPNKKNVGIMFGTDHTFLGIDIDHCIEDGEIVHEERDRILAIIDYADTYTELSPSKTGIHLYIALSAPLELVTNKKAPYECYTAFRFFTVTGEPFGANKPVRTVTPEEALSILSVVGYPWGKVKREARSEIIDAPAASLDDTELLKKMFRSKTGDRLRMLYDGDLSGHKGDHSSADMALCNALAFWTRMDYAQIERMWLASPLGQRDKTRDRQDYRERTISAAIANCKEVYTPREKRAVKVEINEDEQEVVDFDFLTKWVGTKNPVPVVTLCMENIAKVLRRHPEFTGNYRFDTFKMVVEKRENGIWTPFIDNDILTVQARISILFEEFQTVKKEMIYDAVCIVAHEHGIDSAIDYITSIKWDGVNRLDTWLCSTYGVESTEYHRKAGSNWLKGLVKRICMPGCKFDYVLVLEGPQGTKKSSSFGVLGGDWYVETTMETNDKDFFMQFAAKAIVEFSEGETLSRTEVKRMKAIITTQSDKYRAPYERVSIDHPRRCVFAMTTNTSEYLKDETGNRRWWPIATKLKECNLEWLRENRDQLFAEAYHRVMVLNESTWEMPEEETMAQQEARRIPDSNEETVIYWYDALSQSQKDDGITVAQVHIEAFGNAYNKRMNKIEEMSIANVLKNTLKLIKKQSMIGGIRASRWYPNDTVSPMQVENLADNFEKF